MDEGRVSALDWARYEWSMARRVGKVANRELNTTGRKLALDQVSSLFFGRSPNTVKKIIGDLLAELALGADRIERLEQRGLDQLLGRNRGPALLGIRRVEVRAQPVKFRVGPRLIAPRGWSAGIRASRS